MKPHICLIAILLVSCNDPLDVDFGSGPLFQTDATSYLVVPGGGIADVVEVDISFTFENRLPHRVYLAPCSGDLTPDLERKVGDGWRTAWSRHKYCTSGSPVVIEPGTTYADTVRVVAHPFGDEREPQFSTPDVNGIHRLQWTRALRSFDPRSSPPGEPLPLRHRISNEFHLQAP